MFAALAERLPADARILSFGCSTGEELASLRRLMPGATLVGVEINPRARRIARRRMAGDPLASVVEALPDEPFDAVVALAVLQREPHRILDNQIADLSRTYPFARFDSALERLVERLREGGLLAVYHAHYRVEDSRVAALVSPLPGIPFLLAPLFDRHSQRYEPTPAAASLFVKDADKCAAIAPASAKK
ncbi:MAG: methyltransferase [Sphingomicrobium sp.]